MRAAAHGSLRGQLVVEGTLGYLLYTYLVFAFDAVLNPVTVLYIAVVGCALDLAFVLPLSAVTGLRLLRGRPANRVAIPLLVFTPAESR